MTTARNHRLFLHEPHYYHLISRCVRRAFLCGKDRCTGKRYDHRKRWLEQQIHDLAKLFYIDLYGYVIMSNHYHLVVRTRPDEMLKASDEQVARRWCRLFPRQHEDEAFRVKRLCQQVEKIQVYRNRLCDISWLMRCMNEPIARRSNREDGCTGRFWQGRFRSQMLLDEAAVYTCMAYVDLNPVRAGLVPAPEQSKYTSLSYRIAHHQLDLPLSPIIASQARLTESCALTMRLDEYLSLVDETSRCIKNTQLRCLPDQAVNILDRIGLTSRGYLKAISGLSRSFYRAIGSVDKLDTLARELSQNWLVGRVACRKLYR